MSTSIRQQTQQVLEQLPPEGLEELAGFIEFLRFKYRLAPSPRPTVPPPTQLDIPPDSLTARFRGFIQSPLSVAELTAAYELYLIRRRRMKLDEFSALKPIFSA